MRAYHFTSAVHLSLILDDGRLRRTESNPSLFEDHAGPDVVWLLDGPELDGKPHGLHGSAADKTEIRFEVDAPDRWTVRWLAWAEAQGIAPEWRDTLIRGGGGQAAAERWLICFAEIPSGRWVRVDKARTGRTIWEREEAQ